MPRVQDPTEPIRKAAITFPGVAKGTSCNQSSFKAGKGSFLFIGPGPKGQGFKAMFKLSGSMSEARKMAAKDPDRFQVGSTGWVTARFSADKPLPKSVWTRWLQESYDLTCGIGPSKSKPTASANKKKGVKKKTASRNVKKKAGNNAVKKTAGARTSKSKTTKAKKKGAKS